MSNESIHPAYVAGIIDGEGSLSLRRSHKGQIKPIPSVTVRMTHKDTIAKLAEAYKPNDHYVYDRGRKLERNWKPSWHICWRGEQAIVLLEMIRPHLITKAAHADILLEVGTFVCRGFGRPKRGTSWWTDEERLRMETLLSSLTELNKRGR